VTLRDLDQQARTALAELLRLDHIPPAKVHVDVQRLARALHIEASDVVAVVERIRGPLDNRARARAAAATARAVAADRLAEAAMAVDHRLCDWARRQAIAVDGDLDAQVATVEAALQVLAAASEAQPEPLPVVACRVLGDPHAADLDRNVGRVLRSALGTLGLEGSVREHMLKVGLADDEVSSTVATWALPLPTDHPSAGWYEAGEIVVMTLGQLRRHPIERAPRSVTVLSTRRGPRPRARHGAAVFVREAIPRGAAGL
jgi:hypothetical protein